MSETFTPSSSYTLGQIDILGGVSAANTTLSLHLDDVTGVDKQGSGFPAQICLAAAAACPSRSRPPAGNTYALEIWTPLAVRQNNFQWYRGGVVATDGQMMGSHDAAAAVSRNILAAPGLAGGAPRTGSLALYVAASPWLAMRTLTRPEARTPNANKCPLVKLGFVMQSRNHETELGRRKSPDHFRFMVFTLLYKAWFGKRTFICVGGAGFRPL